MTMRGPRTSRLLLKAPLYTSNGVFSPDMRWIAYSTRESGMQRVFATPYPGPGPRIPVSSGYGGNPVWRKDGRAVFYEADNSNIRVTEVSEHGSDLRVGKTREIPQVIEAPVGEGFPFDVAGDGKILLISRGNDNVNQLVVVSNWDVAPKK
jgi:Tol biopolymer transport system component